MSTWSQPKAMTGFAPSGRRLDPRVALGLACLLCLLVAQGIAITQSYLWAAPLICVLLLGLVTDLPLVPFLGLTLLIRIVTDSLLFSPNIRQTGSLNFSALIALLFILVAVGLLVRRRQGARPAVMAVLWLCLWTAIAVNSHGASTVTIREGVREASIVALGVIVFNARGVLNIPTVTRLIQVVGVPSALLAFYQMATHSGLLINGEIRSNGTFAHPNSAAMFFAIAVMASLWRYIDNGRRRSDAIFAALYAAAAITTFSLSGLAALLAMLMVFGAMRPGSVKLKFGSYAVAGLIVVAFLATPLGAERVANESSTRLSSAQTRGAANTSFAWRLYKWRTLLPEWEKAPFQGQGLGTTITTEGTVENVTAGKVPHNEYVRYLVETGALGLGILFWAIFALVRRLNRRRGTVDAPGVGTLGLAIVAGCLVNALADNTFLYSTTGYAVAMIVAAILGSPIGTAKRTPTVTVA